MSATPAARRAREEAARWFARLQNMADDDYAECGRFEHWLLASPAHMEAFRSVAQVWDDLGRADGVAALARAAGTERQAAVDRRRLLRRGAVGAFVGVAAGTAGWHAWQPEPWRVAWQTGPGETRREVLEDGSRLTLAGATQVTVRYAADERRVVLPAGMAAFEVAHDPARPFVVESGMVAVTVLGTSFGVNRLEGRVRVSVLEGRVRVARRQSWLAGLLTRDAQVWLLRDDQVLEVGALDGRRLPRPAAGDLAWRDGALVFADAGLEELAWVLSRYSARPVRVAPGGALAAVRVAAVAQTKDIDGFLDALPGIAPVRVERRDDIVWLRPKL